MPVGVLYETDSTTLPLVLVWMPTALVISITSQSDTYIYRQKRPTKRAYTSLFVGLCHINQQNKLLKSLLKLDLLVA